MYNAIEDSPMNFDEFLDIQFSTPKSQWYLDDAQKALWNPSQDLITGATEPRIIDTVVCSMQTCSGNSALDSFQSNLLATLPWFQLKDIISGSSK